MLDSLACRRWMDRYGKPRINSRFILDYSLTLESLPRTSKTDPPKSIQVGFLLFEDLKASKVATWQTSDLFVSDSLIGAGIVARFLESLILWFKRNGFVEIRVDLTESGSSGASLGSKTQFRPDPASREERVQDINFYKSRGFVFLSPDEHGQLRTLSLDLNAFSAAS